MRRRGKGAGRRAPLPIGPIPAGCPYRPLLKWAAALFSRQRAGDEAYAPPAGTGEPASAAPPPSLKEILSYAPPPAPRRSIQDICPLADLPSVLDGARIRAILTRETERCLTLLATDRP